MYIYRNSIEIGYVLDIKIKNFTLITLILLTNLLLFTYYLYEREPCRDLYSFLKNIFEPLDFNKCDFRFGLCEARANNRADLYCFWQLLKTPPN